MTNGDEQMSQLAKDLERAMNPTPTEPVPQPYFLQGKGLLERIPNQDSMDDGNDQDDQYSEVINICGCYGHLFRRSVFRKYGI